jgi:hypothetical protein
MKDKSITELKVVPENAEKHIQRVGQGEYVTVVDFTAIQQNGVPAQDILTSLRKLRG